MSVPATVDRLLDQLEHRGKAAAKALYRSPVIMASRLWRSVLRGTCCIGVTGSAGKTTTKELLHRALAARYRSRCSADSNNQLYSIARTLLGTGLGTSHLVQELGASEPGAFDPMLALLRPRVGIVTNIGTDHFKAFRTRAGVAAEKGRLIASLPPDGIAVLNADDELVIAMGALSRARIVTFGLARTADYRGEVIRHRWPDRLALRIHRAGATAIAATRLLGAHQAGNVLAAVAAACELGVPLADAADAIGQHEPVLGRMSVQTSPRGVTFVRDDWKAPLWSLPVSCQFIRDARASRKLIVIGTLSDYGGNSAATYRRSVLQALDAADLVLLVGHRAASLQAYFNASAGSRLQSFATVLEAAQWLQACTGAGDLVLLKGSNQSDHLARLALAMEQPVRCWRHKCGRQIFCDRCRLLRVQAEA